MRSVQNINQFIQFVLHLKNQDSVSAIEAEKWLDGVGLLTDSTSRPGLPFRNLLRKSCIEGQRQEVNRRWYVDNV